MALGSSLFMNKDFNYVFEAQPRFWILFQILYVAATKKVAL
jgi:hypothetical protein